ncbi:MAG: type II secretion system protein [Burkholderiales bacterium]|nr:type II secretion system protein [Burkholderiales bacterium]
MYTEARHPKTQAGISLVELIMFIVIVSIAVAGILSVMNVTSRASADPMQRKQAVAVAESLLEEIELQSLTFCDPDDVNARNALSTADCATVQGLGRTAGETRSAEPRFDNVGDYHGFSMSGIRDLQDTAIAGLESYTASVNIVEDGASFGLAAADALRIDVHVVAGTATDITLSGYRFRYAPRAVP